MCSLDNDLQDSEVLEEIVEVHDVLDERDILERENETAVLHLQSAEEQERREREGLEGAVEQQQEISAIEDVLLQGPFPTGATVLCITENQEETAYNKDSLLYYQLGSIDAGAFETLPRAEEEQSLGYVEISQEEVKTAEEVVCSQDVCTNRDKEEHRCPEERPPSPKSSEQCQEETCQEPEVY